MKRLPYPKTIRGKIITMTASITVMITIITVSICFSIFQSFLKKNQLQSAEFNLQLVANNVSSDIKDIVYLSKWCSSNTDLLDYLEAFYDKDKLAVASKTDKSLKPKAISTYLRLKEEYFNTKPSDYISRLVITNNNSTNFLQIIASGTGSTAYNPATLAASEFYPDLYNSPDYEWIGFTDDPFFSDTYPGLILPIVRPIYNQFNSNIIGQVYLSISPRMITDYLNAYPLAEDSCLYISIGDNYYQIENNEIKENAFTFTVLSTIQNKDLDAGTTAQIIQLPDGSKHTLLSRAMEPSGWSLCQVLSVEQLNEQKQVYVLLIVGICFIILSLGFALVVLLNRTINIPVTLVKQKIDAISHGDFSRDESIEWEHEIGDIGRGINNLSKDVVNLMDKRVDDEKQRKDLEYQILQSQINPHFLYNTLNSIKWMATIQGASGIAEIITALARLLKNISKGTTTLITLGEELELVKDYFLIQQYRYGGSITIDYQIESEDLYQCNIHRFSLQPIIENALFHGIEPKGSAGKIIVAAHVLTTDGKKNLQISITDNGVGMTEETIQMVLHSDQESKTGTDFFKQVGIHNVNQRLQYDFGPSYGITIESVPGEYTTMFILIPYINEDNMHKGKEFYD